MILLFGTVSITSSFEGILGTSVRCSLFIENYRKMSLLILPTLGFSTIADAGALFNGIPTLRTIKVFFFISINNLHLPIFLHISVVLFVFTRLLCFQDQDITHALL